ncbi:MAG TPA: M20/M25/M40 family metallo-hydrolase, partial [Candidatus Gastranaerophilaceae bacterium]|nr:M20/M25/M40 family metallo-hydrolase [Candidatus Gastranaerophilaceae bacterium]
LVQIPSPSMKEEKVIEWIKNFCADNGINCKSDDYGNLIITVSGTVTDKQPLLLSAHMDVVGDASPINLQINDDFIETDKTRTLGADDKAGVACALMLAYEFSHIYPLEIVLTRDEEHGMSGIKHLDFSKLNSKYALVLDADKLGQLLVSGASYTNAQLNLKTSYGGHSGLDIGDEKRLNAAKLIAELVNEIPQGVFYKDETGTITSINIGTIIAGNTQNGTPVTNVINTKAQATYSIRSASFEKENELKAIIQNIVEKFNKKYDSLANAEIIFSQHLPPFEKAQDDFIEKIHTKVCAMLGINQDISSFHAGAETHIYAQNKNSKGETICPFLVGLADVFNMHSIDEKIDYKTLIQGYNLLKEMFLEFNK